MSLEIETRDDELYGIDVSLLIKNKNVSRKLEFSFKDGANVYRSKDGQYQLKIHQAKIGQFYVSLESPLMDVYSFCNIVNFNSFIENPYYEYTVDEDLAEQDKYLDDYKYVDDCKNLNSCKSVTSSKNVDDSKNLNSCKYLEFKNGQCLRRTEQEYEYDTIKAIDIIDYSYKTPLSFSSVNIFEIVNSVVDHGLSYYCSRKLDGEKCLVKFYQNVISITIGDEAQTYEYKNGFPNFSFISNFTFMGEMVNDTIYLFDVCINSVFKHRLDIIKKLELPIHLPNLTITNQIYHVKSNRLEECIDDLFNEEPPNIFNVVPTVISLSKQLNSVPIDGLIIAFDWIMYHYKWKKEHTIDLKKTPNGYVSKENILIFKEIDNCNVEIEDGVIVETTIYGRFKKIRRDKNTCNELFSIYCSKAQAVENMNNLL